MRLENCNVVEEPDEEGGTGLIKYESATMALSGNVDTHVLKKLRPRLNESMF